LRGFRSRLRYFATDAWDEWRRSPGVNLLAVATLASTLFLAALVMLVLSNVEARVAELSRDVNVQVYLEDGISEPALDELMRDTRAMEGVGRVEYVDKAEALRRYRGWASESAELIEELGTNPLPASLEVFLTPGPRAEQMGAAVAVALSGRDGVEEIRFDRSWLRRLEGLVDLARVGGSGLAVIVFAAVIFVMASVLRLAVYARRDEIDIMLLVGATPAFVRGPFLVAGAGQGLIASAAALLLVEIVRRGALLYVDRAPAVLLDLVASRPLGVAHSAIVTLVGLTVSLAGAWFAVRRRAGE
jgi:cell division transport system permease protein